MASPAAPALFFCFAAMVLLIFVSLRRICICDQKRGELMKCVCDQVSVSAPTWEKISFLNANVGGRVIHFGVFGYTGTGKSIGYRFDPALLGFECVHDPILLTVPPF